MNDHDPVTQIQVAQILFLSMVIFSEIFILIEQDTSKIHLWVHEAGGLQCCSVGVLTRLILSDN